MDRPYIFCQMEMSLDGKISGPYMSIDDGSDGWFYREAFTEEGHYPNQGWLSGRKTTEENFTNYLKPDLHHGVKVPDGDFLTNNQADKYYISIDTHGLLGWQHNYVDYGDTHALVIELLTEETSTEYKDFLRRMDIPYIIAGSTHLDAPLAMKKLKELFGLNRVMLGGGGILNWSFIKQGLCDELSLFISPAADGSPDSPSLFQAVPGLSDTKPVSFTLESMNRRNSTIWLRYKVNH
ncbi:5-amino-6-(5-phosphoribosylamino)uracil reductase [Bifidobacterium aemilianum]|uniref:5-amino-6-(5-phosphoribosylamino)uracil reductase n=1 Tax=Bifidobacterium aemilianum TaxID=2493120 RepID=A0A366K9P3_9BIFI|nr:RibD family protein [Bifidobacterium aemilianum]RBP98047.1 5-amino-6-(5-phosphoribosylamino)uracil reductase [Bifidobacterium aemilianum]